MFLMKILLIYYEDAEYCGLKEIDVTPGGTCPWGGQTFFNFFAKTPKLCGITTCNMKIRAELGCRWDLLKVFEAKAPILVKPLQKAGAQATLEFKMTYRYPATLGVAVAGSFRLVHEKKIPILGTVLTGILVDFEASGNLHLDERYLQFRAGFAGKACVLGICFGVSITVASPEFSF